MINLPDIFTVNQFCLRVLSTLSITSFKGIVLFIIVLFLIKRFTSSLSHVKHLILLSVFVFFTLAPLCIWASRIFHLEVIQIVRKSGEPFDSVRSVLLMNTREFSNTVLQNQTGYSTSYQSVYSYSSRLQWPFWVFNVWLSGVLVSMLPIICGLASLHGLKRTVDEKAHITLTSLLEKLTTELGIKKGINFIMCRGCHTPFTSSIFFPKIIVPESFARWPKEQIRIVFLHELAHIKRKDLFTQFVSRLVCSLFWFLPFIWFYYSQLRIEQEKSCDVLTIGSGVYPADYANHLIGLVRQMREQAFALSVYIFKGRKKMIEKRVVNALQQINKETRNKKAARYVLALFLVCLAALLIMNPVSAEDVAGNLDPNKMYYGTWINTDFNNRAEPAKRIISPEGYYSAYAKISDTQSLWGGSFIIEDLWTDEDQITWLKVRTSSDRYYYELCRISDKGNRMEFMFSPYEYPTAINPDHPNYRIYFKLQ